MSKRTSLTIAFSITLLFLPYSLFSDGIGAIAVHGVEGRGKDEQTALNNAFRNAIRKAIGSYVVSSTATDGETVDKKVFDNCDAVVSKYEIVEREEQDGKLTIVIDAEIIRNEMMKYIQKTASTEVDEGELANLLAKRKALNNAVKSLELIFMNWRENVYRAEKYGELSIAANDDTGGDTVRVSVPFIITFNWQAYAFFLSKFKNVLSRIAIDKESGYFIATGDYYKDKEQKAEFYRVMERFYAKIGIARIDTRHIENPNNYGVVTLISHEEGGITRYELFCVPPQVLNTLESLWNAEVEIQFSFSSKGGGTIASKFGTCELRSFGWSDLRWGSFHAREDEDPEYPGHTNREGEYLAIFADKIRFKGKYGGYDGWTDNRLFRATIPMSMEKVARVANCLITVLPKGEDGDDGDNLVHISSGSMSEAEWSRTDGKPKQIKASHPVTKITKSKSVSPVYEDNEESQEKAVRRSVAQVSHGITAVSAKDKTFKGRVDELRHEPPDYSSASKWFVLSNEVESKELRQEMLKAAGAALVYVKKGDVYKEKVRLLIADANAFEKDFFISCPSCNGSAIIEEQCTACAERGNCGAANCFRGRHPVRKGSHYEIYECRECKGSGRCRKCGGTGKIQSNCQHCKGRGKAINPDSVAEAYRNCVACIEEAFY